MPDSRYVVDRQIRQNRFYKVFIGRDADSGQPVLIKRISETFCEDGDLVDALDRILSSIAELECENILRVRNWMPGAESKPGFVIIEEFFPGETLMQAFQRNADLAVDVVIGIGLQICRALKAAALRKVPHGHLTPDSILINRKSGLLKVADFRTLELITSFVTNPIDFQGRDIRYLAPEIITGSPPGVVSDIYSLGTILYEALTGRIPFQDESVVSIALRQVRDAAPEPVELAPDTPKLLNDLIMRCLEKDPSRRIKDPARLISDLELIQSALAQPSEPEPETVVILPDDGPEQAQERRALEPAPPPEPQAEECEAEPEPEPVVATAGREPRPRYVPWFSLALLLVGVFLLTSAVVFVQASLGQGSRTRGLVFKGLNSLCPERSTNRLCGYIRESFKVEIEEVVLPDLRGLTWEQAESRLKSLELKIFFDRQEYREGVRPGIVLVHYPPVDRKVRPGQVVRIVMSRTKQSITVPNVVGLFENQATRMIESGNLLFVDGFKKLYSEHPFGAVIRQEPAPGAVAPVNTAVTLWISQGVRLQMPELIGKYPQAAVRELEGLGIIGKPQFEYPPFFDEELCAEVCVVDSQTPETADEINMYTVARLTLKAPAPYFPHEYGYDWISRPPPDGPGWSEIDSWPDPDSSSEMEAPAPAPPQPAPAAVRAANVQIDVPAEPLLQEVKVMVTDQSGTRTVYRQIHTGGDSVTVYVEGRGSTNVEVFLDNRLIASQQLPQ